MDGKLATKALKDEMINVLNMRQSTPIVLLLIMGALLDLIEITTGATNGARTGKDAPKKTARKPQRAGKKRVGTLSTKRQSGAKKRS